MEIVPYGEKTYGNVENIPTTGTNGSFSLSFKLYFHRQPGVHTLVTGSFIKKPMVLMTATE